MEPIKGTFYGVGIGPGDPELITVKALRVLKECPVIATPQTQSGQMLALDIVKQAMDVTSKKVLPLFFTMSRDKVLQQAAHEQAVQTVRQHLDAGEDVAMLNLGDVSIYSTCSYLIEILAAQGYETVMIPGVPSFCAVAARLNISLTEMNAPLHIAPGGAGAEKLADTLRLPGTKILMKSGKQLPDVLAELDQQGLLEKSAMVRSCGLPDEAVYPSLADFPPQQSAGYFATIVVKE